MEDKVNIFEYNGLFPLESPLQSEVAQEELGAISEEASERKASSDNDNNIEYYLIDNSDINYRAHESNT